MKKVLPLLLMLIVTLYGCSAVNNTPNRNPEKIVIALLDTGVASDVIYGEHLLEGYNYITGTDNTDDLVNHGTAVASTILGCESASVSGLAPRAYIVPLVVASKQNGEAVYVTPETLARALRDSVDIYNANIINVSLGIQKDSDVLYQAVLYANEKGVAVISAVGNSGTEGKPFYPAAYDSVLAVGSCDKDGNRSDFTQDGADVLAPGEDIMLVSRNGAPYGVKGTSFASGFVSAYAANLLMANPRMTVKQLFEQVVEDAREGILQKCIRNIQ